MPSIFLIVVMVFLIALWIVGAYVDVKTIQKQNGHNSGLEGTRTEIVQKDNPKQKHSPQGENNAKGGHIESEAPPKMRATVFVAPPRTPFPIPLENDSLPDPDPVDIPRERMRFLRLPREEEPAPDSEDSRDTPIPDSSPENTGNILDATPEEDCEPIAVNHKDEMIQTDSSVANHSTQTVSHQQDIGVGEQLLIDDSAIQVVPEKQDAQTGEPLMVRDVPIQNVPEKQDAQTGEPLMVRDVPIQNVPEKQDAQTGEPLMVRDVPIQNVPEKQDASMEALPSHHDVSLGNHLSQHEQGVQYDLSTHSIGLDPSDIPVEEKSIQALKSLRDASLQNILVQESMGVGSHVSYRSQEMQAIPERNDASAQHSRNFKSIGVDPRSFHASDFSSLIISEGNHDSSSIKSSVKSENILDKIPLSQSVWIEKEEEQKQPLIKKSPLNLSDLSLAESIDLEQKESLVESILISDYDIENHDEQPSLKTQKSPVKSKKKSQKDSDNFEMISPPKRLQSHSSWELLEDEDEK